MNKKSTKKLTLLLGAVILLNTTVNVFAETATEINDTSVNDENVTMRDNFLRNTGMPSDEIAAIDSDIKDYVVQDLSAISESWEYIETSIQTDAENDDQIDMDDINLEDFLTDSGMPSEKIEELDSDIKELIVQDLLSSGNSAWEYVETNVEETAVSRAKQVLYGITFTVSCFKSGSVIYIYPTYEFTTAKRPQGQDSFSFQLGDALVPYEYGGALWYKDDYDITEWTKDDTPLVANTQTNNGAEFSGSQLGSPDWDMKFKGCTICHAYEGTGTNKNIIMSYLYNPDKKSYSITFSVYGVGITYTPSTGTVYTNAKTVVLSY